MNHLPIIVLLVLNLFKLKKACENAGCSQSALSHHTVNALITDVKHHADDLLCKIQRAASVQYVFRFKFKGGRVVVKLQGAVVLAASSVLPLDLA